MSRIILIHGAMHGGWCWDKVVPLLEAQGHQVSAPDLPGHGNDPMPPAQVTLDAYAERVCAVLNESAEPAILVGHSMGGAVNALAAEWRPERVRRLVFLTALLPRNGDKMVALTSAESNADSLLLDNSVVSADRKTVTIRESVARECFYGDCSEADVARARALVVPVAIAPMATAITLSEANYGRVPRVYIECAQDRSLRPAAQRAMVAASPCERVHTLDSGHSPFFSMPEALVAILHEEATLP